MKSGFMDMMPLMGAWGLSMNAGRKAKSSTGKDGSATSKSGRQAHPKGATIASRTSASPLPQDRMDSSSERVSSDSATKVLLAGQYQNGKSTLINCLLGGDYAIEGDGCHTTAYRTVYSYSEGATKYYKVNANGKRELLKDGLSQTVQHDGRNIYFEAFVPSPVLKRMTLIDAPGWGAEDTDDKQAELSIEDATYVVYLAQAKQLSQEDKNFLRLLKKHNKFFCVLLNARDNTDPQTESVQDICAAIVGSIKQIGLEGQFVKYPSATGLAVVNLLWAKFGGHLLDSPSTDRAKRQALIARMVCSVEGDAVGAVDYESVLQDSGFQSWNLFLDSSLRLITQFGAPIRSTIHEDLSTLICANLVKIVTRM